jgi:hypothetical protein
VRLKKQLSGIHGYFCPYQQFSSYLKNVFVMICSIQYRSSIERFPAFQLETNYKYLGVNMKKNTKTPLAAAMGVALMSTFAASAANAEANPFGASELSQGYMQLAAAEMACGAAMGMDHAKPKLPEAACAGKKTDSAKPAATSKAPEAVCGSGMKGTEGSCGAMHSTTDAKATEASCGTMMENGKMKKGMEGACGAMMKGKEGACGMAAPADSKADADKHAEHHEAKVADEHAEHAAAKTSDEHANHAVAKTPEASCGGMMEDGKMKKGLEGMCGDMMKGKEGACGMMSSGDAMKSKEGSCGAAIKAPEDKAAGTANKPAGVKVIPYVAPKAK